MVKYLALPAKAKDRTPNTYYKRKGGTEVVYWNGKVLKCRHKRDGRKCKDCGGSQICEHNRRRSQCKDCGGASICKHNRLRSDCKDCGGVSTCKHNRRRRDCQDCDPASFCEHNRRRNSCKDCTCAKCGVPDLVAKEIQVGPYACGHRLCLKCRTSEYAQLKKRCPFCFEELK